MAAMPIVLNKASEGNYPRLIAKGAIWDYVDTPPAILTFPDLSGRGTERVMAAQQLIFQSLSINAAGAAPVSHEALIVIRGCSCRHRSAARRPP